MRSVTHGLPVESEARRIAASRITALLYGIGAGLTLDEFALWLHLQDVYWSREGRQSIEALLLFGAFLSAGLWGAPFLNALARDLGRHK